MLIVLVVFYAGLLLFFIRGPSMDDIEDLRKIAFVVLLLGIVTAGLLIFAGLPMFSIGPAEAFPEEAAALGPAMDEEEVLLEEYLGLSEEAAAQEVGELAIEPQSGTADAYGKRAMLCHQCGSRLLEGSQFCHSCGAQVA